MASNVAYRIGYLELWICEQVNSLTFFLFNIFHIEKKNRKFGNEHLSTYPNIAPWQDI